MTAERANLAIIDRRVRMALAGTETIRCTVDSVTGRTASVWHAGALVPAIVPAHAQDIAPGDIVECWRPRGVGGALHVQSIVGRAWTTAGVATAVRSVTWYGVVMDGATENSAALQRALDAGGDLFVPPGVCLLGAPVSYRSDTALYGHGRLATIRAAAGIASWGGGGLLRPADAGQARVTIRGLVIDGDLAANGANVSRQLVAVLDTDDMALEDCTITGCGGIGVYVTTGARVRVTGCWVDDCDVISVYAYAAADQPERSGLRIERNLITRVARHGIAVVGHHGVRVTDNDVSGYLAVGMTCSFSGTTVTHTAGSQDFDDLRVGNFLVHAAGGSFTESLITAIASATSLTIASTVGTHSGVATAGGSGDLISIEGCSDAHVVGNDVGTGVSIGIVLWVFTDQDARAATIGQNRITDIGGPGINIQSSDSDVGTDDPDSPADYTLAGVNATGNTISNVGRRGSAGDLTDYNVGIVVDESTGSLGHVWIAGNSVFDDQGSPTTQYWLRILSNVDAGDVSVGRNDAHGLGNPGIAGGASVALGSGWGSGASATLVHLGDRMQVAITTGSSPSASPYFDITLKAGPGDEVLMPVVQQVADSAVTQSVHTLLSFVDRKFARITALVTPVNGQVFTFNIRL